MNERYRIKSRSKQSTIQMIVTGRVVKAFHQWELLFYAMQVASKGC